MTTSEYLQLLDSKFGVSGNEKEIRNCVTELFSRYCDEVTVDKLGNVIGIKKGTNSSFPSIMIEAHMDELGFMVSDITKEGSLKFVPIGGFDPKVIPGTEVTVHGKEKLFGVIGAMPPHLISGERKVTKTDSLCVDTGLDKENVEKIVSIGDIITINTFFTQLAGDTVAARCIDDRGGLAIILKVLELLSQHNIQNDLIVVATVQEEVGLRGAKTAAAHIQPGCAIALDVCHGKSPGVSEDAFECGKGPVITIGPNLHSKMTQKLISIANNDKMNIQLEVCEGDTGTDAWEIQISGSGVPSSLISVPVRYMHTNYEVCSSMDLETASRLIASFAVSLKEGDCLCW